MANICVFCGARKNIDEAYLKAAFEFWELLWKNKHTLVYGGWVFGMMGAVFQGIKNQSGKVIWIIPDFLMNKERWDSLSSLWAETITTKTLDERKKIIFEKSDIIVALPGGVGTLDELFEAITLRQLKQMQKKIGILNTNGFFDSLLEFLDKLEAEWFMGEKIADLFIVDSSPSWLLSKLTHES